jgi:hypothetical protein
LPRKKQRRGSLPPRSKSEVAKPAVEAAQPAANLPKKTAPAKPAAAKPALRQNVPAPIAKPGVQDSGNALFPDARLAGLI